MEPLSETRSRERRGRARTLLTEYYELDGGLHAQQTSQDPCDIDGASFDVEQYMEGMMQSDKMKQLLQKTSDIRSEVRTLDNDTQMLVYENYTKFISATETTRQMKASVDGMEGDMQRLADTITKISEGSNRINGNLAAHRAKIDKLTGVKRLLKKLHFLMELPGRLRRCLQAGALEEAVSYYEATKEVLQRFKTLSDFQHLEAQIEAAMADVRAHLRAALHNAEGEPESVCSAHRLLIRLGDSQQQCLSGFAGAHQRALEEELAAVGGSGSASAATVPPEVEEAVGDFHPAGATALKLQSLQPFRDELGGMFVYRWLRYALLAGALSGGSGAPPEPEPQQAEAEAEVNGAAGCIVAPAAGELMLRYVELAEAQLLLDSRAAAAVAGLVVQLGRFSGSMAHVVRLVAPELGSAIGSAASAAAARVVDAVVTSSFGHCRECLAGALTAAKRQCEEDVTAAAVTPPPPPPWQEQINVVAAELSDSVGACLGQLRGLLEAECAGFDGAFRRDAMARVYKATAVFYESVGEELGALAGSAAADRGGLSVCLYGASLCRVCATGTDVGVSAAEGALRQLLPHVDSSACFEAALLRGCLQGHAQHCLRQFVLRGSEALAALAAQAFTRPTGPEAPGADWMMSAAEAEEATAVRPVVEALVAGVMQLVDAMRQWGGVVGAAAAAAPFAAADSAALRALLAAVGGGAMAGRPQSLLEQRPSLLAPLAAAGAGEEAGGSMPWEVAVPAALALALQALVELLRAQEFSAHGRAQVCRAATACVCPQHLEAAVVMWPRG
jgi:hypothetical protein